MKRLLVCLLLVGVVGCGEKEEKAAKAMAIAKAKAAAEYNKGVDFADHEDWATAIACFTEAIRIKPDYAMAYIYRGIAYGELGQYDKAIADYTEAIRIKPDYAMAYNSRGIAYGELGQYDKAISDYTEAIRKIHHGAPEAYNNRGIAYYHKGEYDKAFADFIEVLRENHNNALAWHGWKLSMTASFIEGLEQQIATLHEEMADPEYFRRSAELRAADKRMLSEYEQQLAALLEDRARLDELSNRDWQKHQKDLELRIDYERRSYEDRRDRELGLRLMRVHELQKLNFLTLNDAFPYFRRGSLYSADRQYGWAIADYTEAIRIDLFHAEAYYNRGVAHRELGNDVKAAADFAKAKELGYEPDDE